MKRKGPFCSLLVDCLVYLCILLSGTGASQKAIGDDEMDESIGSITLLQRVMGCTRGVHGSSIATHLVAPFAHRC